MSSKRQASELRQTELRQKVGKALLYIFAGAGFVSLVVISLFFLGVRISTPVISQTKVIKDLWQDPKSSSPTMTSNGGESIDLQKLNSAFTNLAASLSPSVVNVFTKMKAEKPTRKRMDRREREEDEDFGGEERGGQSPEDIFRFFFGNPFRDDFENPRQRESQSLGSGFVINAAEGLIVTNSHVVSFGGKGADEIMVKFVGDDKTKGLPAEVVGIDTSTDVAVLRLKTKKSGLKAVVLGDSEALQVGEWVLAIGNPYGHSNSVTQGIISALGRDLEGLSLADFIQTSASINPGNSGGPLFNMKGEVIGINSAIDPRAQGIGFAIPINTAKNVIRQIVEKGEVSRGWIGVGIADVTPEVAEYFKLKVEQGVLIESLEKGEPAEKAGLKPYDVIITLNGKKVASRRELASGIGAMAPGTSAKLGVLREGKEFNLEVKVAKRPSDDRLARRNEEPQKERGGGSGSEVQKKLGMSLSPVPPEMKRGLKLGKDVEGVFVNRVRTESPADRAGIRAGDVLLEMDTKPIVSVSQANTVLEKALKEKSSGKVMIRLLRGGSWSMIVILNLKEKEE